MGNDTSSAPTTPRILAGITPPVRYAARRRANDLIDVSVCIPNWNCRDLLRTCLASLGAQTPDVAVEIIVIDNASTDGAADMVRREFPEVVLHVNPTNVGFARANNQAAELARGRYLFFLNNDTVVPPGVLRRLIDYCEANPRTGMVGPGLRDGTGRYQDSSRQRPTLMTFLHRTVLLRWTGLLRRSYRRYRRQGYEPRAERTVEVLMGAAVFLPRQVFFTCGAWDEDFTFGGEDLELSLRVGRHYDIVYLPAVEITHYGRASTRQHVGFACINTLIGFTCYLRKTGCSPAGVALYKLMMTLDAPLQIADKGVQYLCRLVRGRPDKARKSLLVVRGLGYFLLKGLGPFWRA